MTEYLSKKSMIFEKNDSGLVEKPLPNTEDTMAAAKKIAIQMETVDALVELFRKKWDFEEEDEKMIADFKASLNKKVRKSKKSDDEESAKREPSAYNLFVASKKEELIAAGFKGRDMIREAARMWNAQKEEVA